MTDRPKTVTATVAASTGESALLRHTTARMRIRSGAERPPDGVQLDRFEVSGG